MISRATRATSHLFIVGCARTGSTLLRHALNRSPAICIASETHFFEWKSRVGLSSLLARARRGGRGGEQALARIDAELRGGDGWSWVRRNVPTNVLRERMAAGDLTERSVFATLLQLYAAGRCADRTPVVVGEKTPAHLRAVPTLAEWFPETRVIHTFRDPRAIYASQLRRVREGRWGLKARWGSVPSALLDPLLGPIEAARTSGDWLTAARLHRRYQKLLGPRYLLVRYEDLVMQPVQELRRICEFLEVPFDDALVDGVDVVGSSYRKERHAGGGFDAELATRWRTEVPRMMRGWFRLVAGRELQRFGYPLR